MTKKRQKGTSAFETISFDKALDDLKPRFFIYYLYLCFTPPKILERGQTELVKHWGSFRSEASLDNAMAALQFKGYIRCKTARDNYLPTKIVLLKHLEIPVNENLSFFYQAPRYSLAPVKNVLLNPFDDVAEELKKAVEPKKNKQTDSVNKQTSGGHKNKPSAERLSADKKNLSLGENLKTYSLKMDEKSSKNMFHINVKAYDGSLIKKVCLTPEQVNITGKLNSFITESDDLVLSSKDKILRKMCEHVNRSKKKTVFPKKRLVWTKEFLSDNERFLSPSSRADLDIVLVNMAKNHSDRLVIEDKTRTLKGTRLAKLRYDKTTTSKQTSVEDEVTSLKLKNTSDNTSNNKRESVSISPRLEKNIDLQVRIEGSRCDEIIKIANLTNCDNVPAVARKTAKKGKRMDLQKIKTRYVEEKKARVSQRGKKKNLSEQDVWSHIKRKSLDIFSPQVDREKLLKILALPKKSSIRKELIEELGNKFSGIYFAYRQKLQETSNVRNTYSKEFGSNLKYAKQAAEACIQFGVTPQFVIQYFHESRAKFNPDLQYIPMSVLGNASMVDSAASAYIGKMKNAKFGSDFNDTDRLHPLLRKRLEKAGFKTQDYSDQYLLTVQSAAMTIAEGFPLFVSSEIKGMVNWAAKNVFGGKHK